MVAMSSPALTDAYPAASSRPQASTWLPALLRASLSHERIGLRLLLTAAAALHLAVLLGCPRSFGYVYDFYPAAVAYVYDHHALPPPEACWIGAHPPLLWIVGAPFYAAAVQVQQLIAAPDDHAIAKQRQHAQRALR
jgi:hypothetical protein